MTQCGISIKHLCVLTLIPFVFSTLAFAADKPSVMSMDYCADQYVLALADDDQILGLSHEARMVHSYYRDRAKDLPLLYGSSEEVLTLAPDVIVRDWGGDRRFTRTVEDAGITVAPIRYGSYEDTIHQNILDIGRAIYLEEEAQALVADLEARLTGLKSQSVYPLKAAYITPGGVTAGVGTYVDEVIRLAGFQSSADDLGLAGWSSLPLEQFVMTPPDVMIASFFDLASGPTQHWSAARHHRVREMMQKTPTIIVPTAYLACNGLFMVDAAEFIRAEWQRIQETHADSGS